MPPLCFLLIDDDPDDAEIFTEAASNVNASIKVHHALDNDLALLFLSNPINPRPDLILVDVNMPVVNGWACLSNIKSNPNHSDIPVLIYSSFSPYQYKTRAKSGGAIGFFEKPVQFKTLVNTIQEIAATGSKDWEKIFD